MSISLGFNTAVRALITQQQALNTTAHNIANANTPGFSREDVVLETTDPFTFTMHPGFPTAAFLLTTAKSMYVAKCSVRRDGSPYAGELCPWFRMVVRASRFPRRSDL